MIKAIKIKPRSPHFEKSIALTGLGKINIICGKNNSGKTTLLSEIAQNNFLIGKKTNDINMESFFFHLKNSSVSAPSGVTYRPEQLISNVRNVIERYLETEEFWFSDNVHNFIENTSQEIQKWVGNINAEILYNRFQNSFQDKLLSILIPNKRNIDLQPSIDGSKEVIYDGRGLLNKLFYLKNQLPGSMDRRNYEIFSEAFEEISNHYQFEIEMEKGNKLALKFSSVKQNFVPAKNCGLGLQDLMVILYFALLSDKELLLIEEPETHLHPDMQRRLIIFLRQKVKEKQFFFTTHSNIFLNSALVDKVFFTTYENGIEVRDETNRAFILSELGYEVTDNLVSDLVILVEGPTDVLVLESLLMKMDIWDKYNIKFWPLGGHIMDKVDLSVFAEKYSMMALVDKDDKDKGARIVRDNFQKMCEEKDIYFHRLERYAIENYFPLKILKTLFKGKSGNKGCIDDIAEESLNHCNRLKDEIGIDVKSHNHKIAKLMTIRDIEGTDLHEFLLKVKENCESIASCSKKI